MLQQNAGDKGLPGLGVECDTKKSLGSPTRKMSSFGPIATS